MMLDEAKKGKSMLTVEHESLDAILFASESKILLDLKCFVPENETITADDIKKQIHSALIQERMGRATISERAPSPNVTFVDVEQFVKSLD